MNKTYKQYIEGLKGEHWAQGLKFPDVSMHWVYWNTEMMSTEEESSVQLFLAGIITKEELIKCLQEGYDHFLETDKNKKFKKEYRDGYVYYDIDKI